MKYADRFYRSFNESERWTSFRVRVETSDLYIRAGKDLAGPAQELVTNLRNRIREHIERQESFLTSFEPVERLPGCAEIIDRMYDASEQTGTGPMAAVAGAIAEVVGRGLMAESREVIVENGGDVWLSVLEPVKISIFTEGRYFKDRVTVLVRPDNTPCGICTSSGKTGPSISFGRADSATVVSPDAAFADAAATGACNLVKDDTSLDRAIDYCFSMKKTSGAVIIFRDKMALRGDIELTEP